MALPLLLMFSLQRSRICFSSSFSQSCGFENALWVKSLSDLQHSPSSTNSMSCSIKPLICHLPCLFSIPAMMKNKTFNIFISSNYTQKENKENRAQTLYLGQNQVHSKHGRQFPNLYLSCIELLSKKERSNGQIQTKLQELGILDGILVYGAQLKIRFSTQVTVQKSKISGTRPQPMAKKRFP